MTQFEIDSDVPLPRRRGGRPRHSIAATYPFGELDVGQSFFVPGGMQSTVSSAKVVFETRFPEKRFATRYVDADPKFKMAGVRVWRIK